MSYTDKDICKFYRNGSDLTILQDLTLLGKNSIIEILEKNNFEIKNKKSSRNRISREMVLEHHKLGLNNS